MLPTAETAAISDGLSSRTNIRSLQYRRRSLGADHPPKILSWISMCCAIAEGAFGSDHSSYAREVAEPAPEPRREAREKFADILAVLPAQQGEIRLPRFKALSGLFEWSPVDHFRDGHVGRDVLKCDGVFQPFFRRHAVDGPYVLYDLVSPLGHFHGF